MDDIVLVLWYLNPVSTLFVFSGIKWPVLGEQNYFYLDGLYVFGSNALNKHEKIPFFSIIHLQYFFIFVLTLWSSKVEELMEGGYFSNVFANSWNKDTVYFVPTPYN